MDTKDFAVVDSGGAVVNRIVCAVNADGQPVTERPAREDEAEVHGVAAGEKIVVPFDLPDSQLIADPDGAATIGGRWDGAAFLPPEALT